MPLAVAFATFADDAEFAAFCCWDGDDATPWAEEAENYVRGWALQHAEHVLAFRDNGGSLVAVSAFDRRVIAVPLVAPQDHPGWHLQVVAVDIDHQGRGVFGDVMSATYDAMRSLDPDRVLVTAHVHRDNEHSLKACRRHGLLPFVGLDEHYLVLLGEVPP